MPKKFSFIKKRNMFQESSDSISPQSSIMSTASSDTGYSLPVKFSSSEKTVPCDKLILQPPSLLSTQDNNKASDTFYEVEFLKGKKVQKGTVFYLVGWKGYSEDDDTWEAIDNIEAPRLIGEFEKACRGRRTVAIDEIVVGVKQPIKSGYTSRKKSKCFYY